METKVTAVNGHGHLTIGGLDTVALASKYGTPLYVMDEDAIRANCRALKNSMDAHYHKKGLVLYASKAFCCKRMYRILNEEGLVPLLFPPAQLLFQKRPAAPPSAR